MENNEFKKVLIKNFENISKLEDFDLNNFDR